MFALYSEERRIFSFDDYGALLEECRRLGARSALEFGPGVSTLALIEAGLDRIDTCEYQDRWLTLAAEAFRLHPQVTARRYVNDPAVEVEGLPEGQRFDVAFVDSPLGLPSRNALELPGQEGCNRLNTALFALARAPVVLLHDARRPGESGTLARLAAAGHGVTMIETRKGIARIERRPATGAA